MLACLISLVSATASYYGEPEELNWLHYDQTQQLSRLPPANDIVIIEIDDISLGTLGHWPWPRKIHGQLLDQLGQYGGGRAIVFDVLFPSTDPNAPASDRYFSQAIRNLGNVFFPIYFEALGHNGVIVESLPLPLFSRYAEGIGHIHFRTETDGVVRSVYLKQGIGTAHWPHISQAVAQYLYPKTSASPPGQRLSQPAAGSIGLTRDYFNLVPMPSREQGIRHFSYRDVLTGRIDDAFLRDKTIFIGSTATGLGDVLATPVGSMPGIELNAWLFHALRHQQLIQPASPIVRAAITFCVVLALVALLGRLSPRWFLLCTLLAIISIAFLSSATLLFANFWLPVAAAMLGVTLFFPLWSWLRAEHMLSFLRRELWQLNDRPEGSFIRTNPLRESRHFLQQLGLISNPDGQPTEAGIIASHNLSPQHDDPTFRQRFWPSVLQSQITTDDAVPEQDKRQGVELIAKTITQLSLARKKEAHSRQLIEQSLSGLQDAICITDICGQITYTNQRFRDWFLPDASRDKPTPLLTLLDQLVLKSNKSWEQVIKRILMEGNIFYEEAARRLQHEPATRSIHDENTDFLCQISLVRTGSEHKDTLIFAFTDVSRLKAAENARAEALSFLSHDLRSPMVSVLSLLEKIRLSGKPMDDRSRQHIEQLVRKNLDYAESFLQLSKASSLAESSLVPCDLHAVLDSAQVHAMALAAPRSIKVITERCDDEAWVLGDMSLLERSMNNLISNAIKYSSDNTAITLSLKQNGTEWVLAVRDQGAGIAPEDQENLFKRFQRRASDPNHGAGLGLNFVATVVRQLHGEVHVSSERTVGSTFSLHLPALNEADLLTHFS